MNSPEYQEFLSGEGDTKTLQAIVAIVGYEQAGYNYFLPSFSGTSKCRDVVEGLVEAVLYAGKSLDQAYSEALAELRVIWNMLMNSQLKEQLTIVLSQNNNRK